MKTVDGAIDRPCRHASEASVRNERCEVFGEGDDLYASMLTDIAEASHAIRLESYIFAGDEVGWRFAEALAERARAGVRVRVHVDAAGALFEGTEKLFRRLLDAGVEARWFNRWRWRDPWHYNRRNHRKLLVVDETCLYVGGFNIHRESSQALVGPRRWRDVHVRHAERLIDQAMALFDELWDGRPTRTPPPWDGLHRLLPNATRTCRRVLHCLYLDALADAEQSVFLATPYFVPDRRFRAALGAAARRGVEVRVLLPSQSDQRLVQWASHALARPLAREGVKFFDYLPRMLHAKVTLIDGRWAMVGSANADYRSFFVNHELNLVSRAPALCQQLNGLLAEDFAQARRLDLPRRPRNRVHALAESLAHRLRRWL